MDARDKKGGTALYRGCENGRIGAVEALLRVGPHMYQTPRLLGIGHQLIITCLW